MVEATRLTLHAEEGQENAAEGAYNMKGDRQVINSFVKRLSKEKLTPCQRHKLLDILYESLEERNKMLCPVTNLEQLGDIKAVMELPSVGQMVSESWKSKLSADSVLDVGLKGLESGL